MNITYTDVNKLIVGLCSPSDTRYAKPNNVYGSADSTIKVAMFI